MTDFGSGDYFVGSMKGVLLRHAPAVTIVDITHDIPPQDLIRAAFVVKEASVYFPAGTIHLAIVDPGVGTDRRKIIVTTEKQLYLAPDNGILTYLLLHSECRVYAVDQTRRLGFKESPTFAGRDHFAPIAALLVNGTRPEELGPEIRDGVVLDGLLPKIENSRIIGKIVYIDRFGNGITNITESLLIPFCTTGEMRFEIKGHRLTGLKKNYSEGEKGAGNLIINSSGHLEIFVPGRSAESFLGLRLLDVVRVGRIDQGV